MRQLLLLSIAIFAFTFSFGQSRIIFKETVSDAYLVHLDPDATSAGVTNEMIQTIAAGNNRPPRAVEFEFKFDRYTRFTHLGGENYEIYVHLDRPMVAGYTTYKDFDVSHVLLPDQVNFDLRILNQQNEVLGTYRQTDAQVQGIPAVIAKFKVQDSTGYFQSSRVEIANKQFRYTRKAKRNFDDYIRQIEEYYAFGNQLQDIERQLSLIQPQQFEIATDQANRLGSLREQLAASGNAPFFGALMIGPANDPANHLPWMNELNARGDFLQRELDATLARLPELFYERGLGALNVGSTADAVADFNRSVELNPSFAPAHLELARFDFSQRRVDPAAQRLTDIFTRLNPDPGLAKAALDLSNSVFRRQLELAANAERKGQFNESLNGYRKAQSFCNAVSGLNCGTEVTRGINSSVLGLHEMSLSAAEQAIEQKDAQAAEKELLNAQAFRENNPGPVFDRERESALWNRARILLYTNFIEAGRAAHSKGDFEYALKQFREAQDLEGQFEFSPDPALPDLIQASAKAWVLKLNQEGKSLAAANDLIASREAATQARTLADQYALKEDPEVKASFDGLSTAIFDQECTNAQNEFNAIMQRADQLKGERRFIPASEAYGDAISFASRNRQCGISDAAALAAQKEILPAKTYQEKMEIVGRTIGTGDYQTALRLYADAGKYHTAQNVGRFRVNHLDEFDYIRQNPNYRFIHHGAGYFANRDEFSKSIDLMTLLLDRRYSKKLLKPVMVKVGMRLAGIDAKRIPNANPKVQVLEYTHGHKKLKDLKKTYIKQFKSIK